MYSGARPFHQKSYSSSHNIFLCILIFLQKVRKMSGRGSSFTTEEDILLCKSYLDISQDPITGRNQSSDRFWGRIMEQYNSDKPQDYELRNTRSLQSRMSIISAAVKKMNGCVRQIENMHPSGASEQDIVSIENLKIILNFFLL